MLTIFGSKDRGCARYCLAPLVACAALVACSGRGVTLSNPTPGTTGDTPPATGTVGNGSDDAGGSPPSATNDDASSGPIVNDAAPASASDADTNPTEASPTPSDAPDDAILDASPEGQGAPPDASVPDASGTTSCGPGTFACGMDGLFCYVADQMCELTMQPMCIPNPVCADCHELQMSGAVCPGQQMDCRGTPATGITVRCH